MFVEQLVNHVAVDFALSADGRTGGNSCDRTSGLHNDYTRQVAGGDSGWFCLRKLRSKAELMMTGLLRCIVASSIQPGRFFLLPVVWLCMVHVCSASDDEQDRRSAIRFLSDHCVKCHRGDTPKSGFGMESLIESASGESDLQAWKEIARRLESRDMPPKDEPRPTDSEYETATAAIREIIERQEVVILSKAPRPLRRLNRVEYANTMRDIFGIRFRPGEDFPPDGMLHGFNTVADGLTLSPSLVEKYLASATAVLDRAFVPVDPNYKVPSAKYAFYEEHANYPPGSPLRGFGVYNGNAHLSFGSEASRRIVYIGGPAIFTYGQIDPVNNAAHAFNSEGLYRLRATLTPQKFEPGEVASFTILGCERRRVAEVDVPIQQNGTPITIDAEGYYDRTESTIGFELNWTNGNHLQWPARGPLARRPHPFEGSDINKPWSHINYRQVDGRWVEWKPASPEELPFSYFEKVEFEVVGPIREMTQQSATLLGTYLNDQDAVSVLSRFLPIAFRRPVEHSEVERYAAIVGQQRDRGMDSLESLKMAMAAALCSPHFLLMVEIPPQGSERGEYTLNDHELATRLSYFLWSSCPDEELRTEAISGQLTEKAALGKQVSRMLADPRAKAFTDAFARQWLNLDKLATVMPEPKLFPYWSDDLRDACRDETLAFFHEVLTADLPVTEFLMADWTFANETLADHYGLPPVSGRPLRKVTLPDNRRGGLISQASILTLTSEATRTAPVIRGAYVLDRLFHRPPPPPPPNVGALIPDASGARSVREHLAIHRANPTCAGCHARFDGYGLALENFDAIGRWRTEESAHEDPAKPIQRREGEKLPVFGIDATAELSDGTKLDGVAGLKKHLVSRKTEFVRGLAERITIYACGRGLTAADRPSIEAIVQATSDNGDRFQSLILAIVDSPPFRTR